MEVRNWLLPLVESSMCELRYLGAIFSLMATAQGLVSRNCSVLRTLLHVLEENLLWKEGRSKHLRYRAENTAFTEQILSAMSLKVNTNNTVNTNR